MVFKMKMSLIHTAHEGARRNINEKEAQLSLKLHAGTPGAICEMGAGTCHCFPTKNPGSL